ncbi:MAG: hypothetical protein RLZZ127_1288 [Planctomycetota bacterium]|jgi:formylglycine-generating enzyme required for sulfatase activity
MLRTAALILVLAAGLAAADPVPATAAIAKPRWARSIGSDAAGTFAVLQVGLHRLQFRLVPAGTFTMGDDAGHPTRRPARQVVMSRAYWLADSETPDGLFTAIWGADAPGIRRLREAHPVTGVSIPEIRMFLERLNGRIPGLAARLPTEAEWEYACTAGGSEPAPADLEAVAWGAGNAKDIQPVRGKAANAWGFHDMIGNASEVCADWFAPYDPAQLRDPAGAAKGPGRVERGGSFKNSRETLLGLDRGCMLDGQTVRSQTTGFRIAVDAAAVR